MILASPLVKSLWSSTTSTQILSPVSEASSISQDARPL